MKAAWIKNCSILDSEYEYYAEAIVNAVIICISRFQEMHTIYIASQGTSNSEKSRLQEVEKNIYLLTTTLADELFLIDGLITAYGNEKVDQFLFKSMARLISLDIVKDILQIVELILAGFKFLDESHLRLALNIIATLCGKGFLRLLSTLRRNQVVKSLAAFLGSDKVDMVDCNLKLLLHYIVRYAQPDSIEGV